MGSELSLNVFSDCYEELSISHPNETATKYATCNIHEFNEIIYHCNHNIHDEQSAFMLKHLILCHCREMYVIAKMHEINGDFGNVNTAISYYKAIVEKGDHKELLMPSRQCNARYRALTSLYKFYCNKNNYTDALRYIHPILKEQCDINWKMEVWLIIKDNAQLWNDDILQQCLIVINQIIQLVIRDKVKRTPSVFADFAKSLSEKEMYDVSLKYYDAIINAYLKYDVFATEEMLQVYDDAIGVCIKLGAKNNIAKYCNGVMCRTDVPIDLKTKYAEIYMDSARS